MAANIVTEIIGLIAPAALDRIAAALGLSGDAAKKALGTAVPALLAALGAKAASPWAHGRCLMRCLTLIRMCSAS